jgi:hypothetical protein
MKKIILSSLLLTLSTLLLAHNYSVLLQSGSFVPVPGKLTDEKWADSELVHESYYRYIQFYSLPTEQQKKELAARGVWLHDYVPNNTYIAEITSKAQLSLIDSRNIRAVFPIQQRNKLDVLLTGTKYPKWARRGDGNIEVMVSHHQNLRQEDVAAWLAKAGFKIIHSLPRINSHRLIIKTSEINKIAALPFVLYIEPFDDNPQPDNLVGRTSHRSNMIATDYSTGLKYDGTGVNLALNDDGMIGPHIDYQGRLINQYTTSNAVSANHGDHCAGIIMSAGNRDPKGRGMAFGANLGVYLVSGSFPSGYQAFDSIYNHYNSLNTRITSTSYSDGANAGYTSKARLMDQQITDMPELMHVFSSGNTGTSSTSFGVSGWGNITGGHKQAKDVITVGNLNYQDVLEASSSRGPAHDGRIKPDICAVGKDVYSTVNSNTYALKTGTSMSCPGVSGTLAQLYQGYKATHGGNNPHSALIKAAVLNTADDLGNAGPDFKYGWGRINARRAFAILQSNQFVLDSISQAGAQTHQITVPTGVSELRVMVYWADPKATAGVAKALVNNLDLTVTTPSAQSVLPWILNPAPNATTLNLSAVQGIDTLNNMEQVTIPSPAAGNYTVNISGSQVPQGPQKYYVVYEYVTNDVTLIYPSGGESLVPAVQETIRWDNYGSTGTFTLEYSTNNGSTWSTIATNIAATQRDYNWTPPVVVTGQALVRITRGTISDVSDAPFSIIGVPVGLTVDWVCIDSMKVSYGAVTGATGYVITRLGNKYMDSVGYSTTTSCILHGINTLQSGWVSVQAMGPNNCKGRRALAVSHTAVPFNCTIPNDLGIVKLLSPQPTTIVDCQGGSYSDTVSIQVRNNGLTPLSNITLKYSVNGGTPVAATYAGPINALVTVNYTFTVPVTFTTPGLNTIKAWLEHPMDLTNGNDTLILEKNIIAPQLVNIPYTQDFETFTLCDTSANCESEVCQLTAGWINGRNSVDDSVDWRINSGPTPTAMQTGTTGPTIDFNPGTTGGQYAYLEATGCYGKEASLISPCINLNGSSTPQLTYAYHMFGSGMGELHVDVLSNGQWINDIATVMQGDQGNAWQQRTISLMPFLNQVINMRFRGRTGPSETSDIAIDNVKVMEASAVELLNGAMNINVYPNPSEGIYHIHVSGVSSKLELTVSDISGKVIQRSSGEPKAGTVNTSLNLAKEAAGVYVLSIRSENGVLTRKLVKL